VPKLKPEEFQNPDAPKALMMSTTEGPSSFLQQQLPLSQHLSQAEHELQALYDEQLLQALYDGQLLPQALHDVQLLLGQLLLGQLLQVAQVATADPDNDTKNITASRRPTVILNICFPIYIHSPNF
jgi:hypothetical protein